MLAALILSVPAWQGDVLNNLGACGLKLLNHANGKIDPPKNYIPHTFAMFFSKKIDNHF